MNVWGLSWLGAGGRQRPGGGLRGCFPRAFLRRLCVAFWVRKGKEVTRQNIVAWANRAFEKVLFHAVACIRSDKLRPLMRCCFEKARSNKRYSKLKCAQKFWQRSCSFFQDLSLALKTFWAPLNLALNSWFCKAFSLLEYSDFALADRLFTVWF